MYQRWYHRIPMLGQAIDAWFVLPLPLQEILGDHLQDIASGRLPPGSLVKKDPSVGVDRILGLYKATSRKRDYDQNAVLHRAMKYIQLLSDESQAALGEQLLILLDLYQRYMALCGEHLLDEDLGTLEKLTATFARHGNARAEALLVTSLAELDNTLTVLRASVFSPVPFPQEPPERTTDSPD